MSPQKPTRIHTLPVLRSPRVTARPAILRAPVLQPTEASRAEALIRDIAARRARIAAEFYEIGVALEKLSRPKVYRALGFGSFPDLLRRRRVMSRMQATKLIAVVRAYPKKLALRLGVEKGYALVRYTAATPAADVALSLARANANLGGKRLHAMTAKDLREETKRLRAGPPPTDEESKSARRSARRLQRSLRAKGAASAIVRAERQDVGFRLRVELDLDEAELFV